MTDSSNRDGLLGTRGASTLVFLLQIPIFITIATALVLGPDFVDVDGLANVAGAHLSQGASQINSVARDKMKSVKLPQLPKLALRQGPVSVPAPSRTASPKRQPPKGSKKTGQKPAGAKKPPAKPAPKIIITVTKPAPGTKPAPKPAQVQPARPVKSANPAYDALIRDGLKNYQKGWYGPALARFRAAAQLSPSEWEAYLWIGRAALKARRLGEAREALERVLALDPNGAGGREARLLLRGVP